MKIVSIGTQYQIYGEEINTLEKLPPCYYSVHCSMNSGFYLAKRPDVHVNEEKVYGVHEEKVQKILRSYKIFDKNLGVILSGTKGIGKSLFAKLLAEKGIAEGLPVIIVDSYIHGIAGFLESIEQEVIVLFDEFEKTFAPTKEEDPQVELLSLFDGISNGKKLFVITCNSYTKLNEFLINRPGRFHYHIRFDYPNSEEVKEYLTDKLKPEYYDQIPSVQTFASRVDVNYDCLRAIAFELNIGLSFKEAIKDLNLVNTERVRFEVGIYYENGWTFTNTVYWDPYGTCCETDWLEETKHAIKYVEIKATVDMNKGQYDVRQGVYIIPGDGVKIDVSYDREDKDETAYGKQLESMQPMYVICKRKYNNPIHYLV